jgi:rhodanese-related sulfurtransferase
MNPQVGDTNVAGGALVVDVREQVEWDAGHISGAVWIPLGELGSRVDELPRDRRMVIVCRTGSRSGYAADALHGAGYDAANLRGGLFSWAAGSLPLEPDGGYVL